MTGRNGFVGWCELGVGAAGFSCISMSVSCFSFLENFFCEKLLSERIRIGPRFGPDALSVIDCELCAACCGGRVSFW